MLPALVVFGTVCSLAGSGGVSTQGAARRATVSEPGASSAGSSGPGSRVHALTPLARKLVREGLRASGTFRGLLDELADTDVIVLIQTGRWEAEEGRCHANLRFVGAQADVRFVRIWVDAWFQSRLDQMALLAHELQHAVEIGRAPHARDAEGVTALFRQIGHQSPDRGFETAAARDVEAVVSAELRSAFARPR